MDGKLYKWFYHEDTPEWAQYICVTSSGACYWYKSEPIYAATESWESADGVFKRIPDVSYPELVGTVVKKLDTESPVTTENSVCPHCGNPIKINLEESEGSLVDYEVTFKMIRKAHDSLVKLYRTINEHEVVTDRTWVCVSAQKVYEGKFKLALVALNDGVHLALSDAAGRPLAQTSPRFIEKPVETFSLSFEGNTYTAVLEASDTDNDFEKSIWFPLVIDSGEFTSIDNFQIPEEACPPLDASGVWGTTLASDMVTQQDITVRYELLASITRDEVEGEKKDAAELCESLVISDGKHFNSIVPAGFLELPDGGSRTREAEEEATVIAKYADQTLVIRLIKA